MIQTILAPNANWPGRTSNFVSYPTATRDMLLIAMLEQIYWDEDELAAALSPYGWKHKLIFTLVRDGKAARLDGHYYLTELGHANAAKALRKLK